MAEQGDLTLGQLLSRGLRAASIVTSAPSPNDPSIQTLLHSALSDLTLSASLISHLGILSQNETVEDINTKDLRCVLVDSARGELEVLAKTKGGKERIDWISRAQNHLRSFIELVDRYEIISGDKKKTFEGPQHKTQDPTRRRESKIAQYKMEKEIKGKLEELRRRRAAKRPAAASSSATSATVDEVDDLEYTLDGDEEEDVARPLQINLILLQYLHAHTELASIEQELELLQSGMVMSDLPTGRERGGREEERVKEDEGSWKIDRLDGGKEGPLLDSKGKVLRPFTILPSLTSSAMSTRLRLSSEVFRSSHRLPTMSIDEFLDLEKERGNILQGGGPASSEAVDKERENKIGEAEDDTEFGRRKEEAGLAQKRADDEWKDTHRKGEGNMHNRG